MHSSNRFSHDAVKYREETIRYVSALLALICLKQISSEKKIINKEDLWPRCKKSLNHRFGRTKFSSYDFEAEFSIYRKRNIYTFVYKPVWLI